MMMTGIMGSCATAPRLNGLKKPRPLKSFSTQSAASANKEGRADCTVQANMSIGSPDSNESADLSHQELPGWKDVAALSSRLFGGQDKYGEQSESFYQQDSSSSFSSYEHQEVFRHQDYCSSLETSALSTPSECNRLQPTSNESFVSQETSFLYLNTRSATDNINNNFNLSLHKNNEGASYSCQPRSDLKEDVCENVCTVGLESGRCGCYRASTPLTAVTQMNDMVQDNSQSFQGQPIGSTRAVLVTGQDDELTLTGKNFHAVFQASRILVKELNAKLVKIEIVNDDSDCEVIFCDNLNSCDNLHPCDKLHSCAGTNEESKLHAPAAVEVSSAANTSSQQNGFKQSWHYSKRQLLRLSMSMLSHQPPSMWYIIANIHSDCCLRASEVKEYFDPSAFHYHDGTLAKARTC